MKSSAFGPKIPQESPITLAGDMLEFGEVYLLEGESIAESAKRVGVATTTAFRWLRDPRVALAFHALAAARFIALKTVLLASVHRKGVQGSAAHAKLWLQAHGLLTERLEITGREALIELVRDVPLEEPTPAQLPEPERELGPADS